MIKPKAQDRIDELFEFIEKEDLENCFNDTCILVQIGNLTEDIQNKIFKSKLKELIEELSERISKITIDKYNKECKVCEDCLKEECACNNED